MRRAIVDAAQVGAAVAVIVAVLSALVWVAR